MARLRREGQECRITESTEGMEDTETPRCSDSLGRRRKIRNQPDGPFFSIGSVSVVSIPSVGFRDSIPQLLAAFRNTALTCYRRLGFPTAVEGLEHFSEKRTQAIRLVFMGRMK